MLLNHAPVWSFGPTFKAAEGTKKREKLSPHHAPLPSLFKPFLTDNWVIYKLNCNTVKVKFEIFVTLHQTQIAYPAFNSTYYM